MLRILPLLLSVMLMFGITGCSENTLPDPTDPVTLTLWHVYGEQSDSPMNQLVSEFNATVGLEKGIVVSVTNVTSTSKISAQLLESQAENAGAPPMPDLFSCHTTTAVNLGAENLVDFNEWFSEKELKEYVPEFLDSGMKDGRLVVFHVSKSSYALFLNGSQFERFSADTGATYDNLATWEGFFDVAQKYYEWSDAGSRKGSAILILSHKPDICPYRTMHIPQSKTILFRAMHIKIFLMRSESCVKNIPQLFARILMDSIRKPMLFMKVSDRCRLCSVNVLTTEKIPIFLPKKHGTSSNPYSKKFLPC